MVTRGPAVALIVVLLGVWLALPSTIHDASIPAAARSQPSAVQIYPPAPDLVSARAAITYRDWQRRVQRRVLRQEALDRLHADFALHAVGTQIYTAWNQPLTLKAINWSGFEYAPFVPDGLDRTSLDTILSSLHSLGFNALRITFSNETVESNPVVTTGVGGNPELKGLHALDIMQRLIQRAHDYGLRVILCNSRSEAGRGPEIKSGLWYTREYSEAAWYADWETLARRFRNDSAFVGADLRNEPHITGGTFDEHSYFTLGPLWGAYHGTYYHDRDWHYAAETLGNDLLQINPHLLIIVEGVQIYLDPYRNVLTGGLWGSNLEGVQYDPIVLSRPGQLVYSVHEYGPHMWQGNWFSPKTTYRSLARRWDRLWGYLLTANRILKAPIFVGEFGTCHEFWACVSSNEGWKQGFWFQSFVRYLHAHPQVGWAYWSLNPDGPFNSHDVNYYGLVAPDWRHYYPLLVRGLSPLLNEPTGLWTPMKTVASRSTFTPEPGCSSVRSCISPVESLSPAKVRRPAPVTALRIQANVPYVSAKDLSRSGDLYLPQGSSVTPRPAVIIVHGQSWSDGTKGTAGTVSLARTLAWHGYVAYDINYRLVGRGGQFPRDIRDVKAAAAFLVANAVRLHIDPTKIGIAGADAGAYLALMAAYTRHTHGFVPQNFPVTGVRIAAVASFFAPIDLEGLGHAGLNTQELQYLASYLGATYTQRPQLYIKASPKVYVDSAVPTILFQGRDDTDASFPQTFRLYRYLKQRAIESKLVDLPGAPHSFSALDGPGRKAIMAQLIGFLDGIFYKPAAQPGQ
jgi:endoglucanase